MTSRFLKIFQYFFFLLLKIVINIKRSRVGWMFNFHFAFWFKLVSGFLWWKAVASTGPEGSSTSEVQQIQIQVPQSARYRWFLLIVMLQLDAEPKGICLLLTQDGTNWTFQCDLTNLQTQISYLMSAEFRLDLSCTGHNSSLISSKSPFRPCSDCFISPMLMDIIANKPGNYRCLKFY